MIFFTREKKTKYYTKHLPDEDSFHLKKHKWPGWFWLFLELFSLKLIKEFIIYNLNVGVSSLEFTLQLVYK